MRKWEYLCEEHLAMTTMGCPFLCHLARDERDSLELLSFYIEDCFWEFTENGGNLDAASIVRLYNCKCELARKLKRLGGGLDGYFEHLLLMSKYVLRRFKIKEARIVAERAATCAMEEFSLSFNDSLFLGPSVGVPHNLGDVHSVIRPSQ